MLSLIVFYFGDMLICRHWIFSFLLSASVSEYLSKPFLCFSLSFLSILWRYTSTWIFKDRAITFYWGTLCSITKVHEKTTKELIVLWVQSQIWEFWGLNILFHNFSFSSEISLEAYFHLCLWTFIVETLKSLPLSIWVIWGSSPCLFFMNMVDRKSVV